VLCITKSCSFCKIFDVHLSIFFYCIYANALGRCSHFNRGETRFCKWPYCRCF